jgi:ribulose kinase
MGSDVVTFPRITDKPMVNGSSDSFYVGIDVGTGSARACIIDSKGDIVGLASQDIKTWNPQPDHYVRTNNVQLLH